MALSRKNSIESNLFDSLNNPSEPLNPEAQQELLNFEAELAGAVNSSSTTTMGIAPNASTLTLKTNIGQMLPPSTQRPLLHGQLPLNPAMTANLQRPTAQPFKGILPTPVPPTIQPPPTIPQRMNLQPNMMLQPMAGIQRPSPIPQVPKVSLPPSLPGQTPQANLPQTFATKPVPPFTQAEKDEQLKQFRLKYNSLSPADQQKILATMNAKKKPTLIPIAPAPGQIPATTLVPSQTSIQTPAGVSTTSIPSSAPMTPTSSTATNITSSTSSTSHPTNAGTTKPPEPKKRKLESKVSNMPSLGNLNASEPEKDKEGSDTDSSKGEEEEDRLALKDFTPKDFTDVTRLAGVDIKQELARALAEEENEGTYETETYEPSFITKLALKRKIQIWAIKGGMRYITEDFYQLAEYALSEHLRNILETLVKLADHQTELHKEDYSYTQGHDIKQSIKDHLEIRDKEEEIMRKREKENLDENHDAMQIDSTGSRKPSLVEQLQELKMVREQGKPLNEKQLKLETLLKEEIFRKRKLVSSNSSLQSFGGYDNSQANSKTKLIDKYMMFSLHPRTLNLMKYMYKSDRI